MPRPLPPALGESIPDPSEGSGNLAPPQAIPEEILRVLGGTGLPGDIDIARIDTESMQPESPEIPVFFGKEEETVPIVYAEDEGIEKALKTLSDLPSTGYPKARNILTQTARGETSDSLYDQIIVNEASKILHDLPSTGFPKARNILDSYRPRTAVAQATINELYDDTILTEAKKILTDLPSTGFPKARDFVNKHRPRLDATQAQLDILHDKTIIDEARKILSDLPSTGKPKFHTFLNRQTPRTAQGAADIQNLLQQHP